MTPEHALGRRAEDLAHRYLEALGMTVIDRNWRMPEHDAEVDIIALDGETLVFVEVKSRTDTHAGDPLRAIDPGKRRRIERAARFLLRRWRIPQERARFDLVAVVFEPRQIRHLRGAWTFSAGDRLS